MEATVLQQTTTIELSMIKRIAIDLIESIKSKIVNNECSDDDIADAMTKFHPESHGYVKEDDFVNYDKALKILGLSNNRAKLNQLCKKYGIKNLKFNNASIGFPKKDIERLAEVLKAKQKK